MNTGRLKTLSIGAAALFLSGVVRAGEAQAAPGVSRPDWVIWATLGSLLLLLLVVILAIKWPGRPKGGSKTGLPYL